MAKLPAPPMLSGNKFLVGHILEFNKNRRKLYERGYKEHGNIYTVNLGLTKAAVLIGPEYQQEFFMQTDKALNISKPYAFIKALFGELMFLASPEEYIRQRPIVYEPFKRKKMFRYIDIMVKEVQKWTDSLGDEGEIELVDTMLELVQNVACCAFLGEEINDRIGAEFWSHYGDMSKALDPIIPPNWPLPKFIKRDKAKKKMKAILAPIIQERLAEPEKYDDFLQDIITKTNEIGVDDIEEYVFGFLAGMMFAGHETTVGQSAWTVIQLLQNPDYLKLVQDEIRTHFPYGEELTVDKMRKMKHISWAIEETSRMYPSADMILRVADEDIQLGEYCIPKGWLVTVATEVAHYLPELFEEPNKYDPFRFAPDRKEDKQHRFAMIGFGGGGHKCPGMHFAKNEMLTIVAYFFQQFDVELITKDTEVYRSTSANKPTKTWIKYKRKPLNELVSKDVVKEAIAGGCPHLKRMQEAEATGCPFAKKAMEDRKKAEKIA